MSGETRMYSNRESKSNKVKRFLFLVDVGTLLNQLNLWCFILWLVIWLNLCMHRGHLSIACFCCAKHNLLLVLVRLYLGEPVKLVVFHCVISCLIEFVYASWLFCRLHVSAAPNTISFWYLFLGFCLVNISLYTFSSVATYHLGLGTLN